MIIVKQTSCKREFPNNGDISGLFPESSFEVCFPPQNNISFGTIIFDFLAFHSNGYLLFYDFAILCETNFDLEKSC